MAIFALVVCALPGCFRAAAAVGAGTFSVHVRPQALVRGPALVLSDVADLSGEDQAVLSSLAALSLGAVADVRLVSRSEILSAIRSRFPDADEVSVTGADFTRVSLATRTPEAAEIALVLREHLASVSPWRPDEIEIRSVDNLQNVTLPQGDITLRVGSRSVPGNYRSAMVPLEAVLDGKILRTYWIKADVRIRARIVQVARSVPFRGTLQADDLREIVSDIEDPRAEYVRSRGEAVGMTARRALAPGELLTRSCLNESSLVRSGETVQLLAEIHGISITTLARALQNGKLGDRIRIRNTDSGRELTAVVAGQGKVQITN